MALTWTGFDLPLASTVTDVIEYFFTTHLATLSNWQLKPGSADAMLFDGGKGGGLIERVVDNKQFALHWTYDLNVTQVDSFPTSSQVHYGPDRFLTSRYWNGNLYMFTVMDDTGNRWADKTEFFGGEAVSLIYLSGDETSVTNGPFQEGETIVIDAAGDNVTATIDRIAYEQTKVALFLSNCSGLPSTHWNSKTVTGNTSGASATTDSVGCPTVHYHCGQNAQYDLRTGPDFPSPTDILTGALVGHTAEVATADATNGRITVTNQDGPFSINEIITWNSGGTEQANVGWMPNRFDVFPGAHYYGSNFAVDDTTIMVGEDQDRLIIAIPNTGSDLYNLIMFGKFWDSGEGHGRMDGCFSGIPAYLFAASVPQQNAGGFIDPDGELFGYRNTINGHVHQISPKMLTLAATESQTASSQEAYWANTNIGNELVDRPTRIMVKTTLNPNRLAASLPEFFSLPAETFRNVSEPGPWAGKQVLALHLDTSGRCVEMNNNALSP